MNKAAQALGRLAKGRPKNYSQEERERRRQRVAQARARRAEKLSAKQDPVTSAT